MSSIAHEALLEILQQLRNYQQKSTQAQFQFMQTAYTLLGRPFLQSLTNIQRNPEDLIIKQNPTFISVAFKENKELLFITQQSPLGFQCICEVAWNRKTNQSYQLMCKHEAAYLLWKYCFPQYSHYSTRLISRDQDPNDLAIYQLLYKAASKQGQN